MLIQRLQKQLPSAAIEQWLKSARKARAEAQGEIEAVRQRLGRQDRLARRIDKLLERLLALGGKKKSDASVPFGAWARRRLALGIKRFFKSIPDSEVSEATLHQFRIRAKELRYALELLAGAFAPELRSKLYPVIENMQDRLGEINDLATGRDRLQKTIESGRSGAEPGQLRQLLAAEEARLAEARRNLRNWCTPAMLRELHDGFDRLLDPSSPTCPSESRQAS